MNKCIGAAMAAIYLVVAPASGQECEPRWSQGVFGRPGVDGAVRATAVWDDGDGPAVFAGGSFQAAGSVLARNIARWDGQQWAPLGLGVDQRVYALGVFDDGQGADLYVGGDFAEAGGVDANAVARWDGEQWSSLGLGLAGSVRCLHVHDDGTGPSLYAGGLFTIRATGEASNIARWDGRTWSSVGAGVDDAVYAMTTWENAGGAVLVAGGTFARAGGVPVGGIAAWDGLEWTDLGTGLSYPADSIDVLAVYDSGDGPELVAGGSFRMIDGMEISNLARWDGQRWAPIGDLYTELVSSLLVTDVDGVELLIAGGAALEFGGIHARGLATWDGTRWQELAPGTTGNGGPSYVASISRFEVRGEPGIVAGGIFDQAGDAWAGSIATWSGGSWQTHGVGLTDTVDMLQTFDDGGGVGLYAGGSFGLAQDEQTRWLAKWDGQDWSPLADRDGSPLNRPPTALFVHDDGSGRALYVGGGFNLDGRAGTESLARWDGSRWSAVGQPITGSLLAMAAFDDGSGEALYAGGSLHSLGGMPASDLLRWDGSSWSSIEVLVSGRIASLAEFDNGSGSALYVGLAGGIWLDGEYVAGIARWDGQQWASLGEGIVAGSRVDDLLVHDDGGGPELYVAGDFDAVSGEFANVARWDGERWHAVGERLRGIVLSLTTHDDGRGPAIYAGGQFEIDDAYVNVARLDGDRWAPLDSGLAGSGGSISVRALTSFAGRGPRGLYAGGDFIRAGNGASAYFARWACQRCRVDLDGDGALSVFDFLQFLNLFDAGDLAADFDGDGELTIFDFLAFQNEFDAGCE